MREFKGDWRDLFFGFRIALDLRKIFLAFAGGVITVVGLFVILTLGAGLDEGDEFLNSIRNQELIDTITIIKYWSVENYIQPVVNAVKDPVAAKGFLYPMVTSEAEKGWLWPVLVLVAVCMWLVFVWSKFGGAITRIAAVEIAKDERISTHEALTYSKQKYSSYFWSPTSVLIAFFFFFFVNALFALIGWIPYAGPIVVGILSPLAFLGGLLMLLIALGGLFGWPLMAPAVSTEGTDAFDAVSRAFSYVYSRPWQYAFYWAVSAVYGVFSVGFVWLCTFLLINLTFLSAQFGMGRKLDPAIRAIFSTWEGVPYKSMDVGTLIMTVILASTVILLLGLGFSYVLSFFYTARTLMYFILRKRVDNTEMTEVYMEDEDEDIFGDDLEDELNKGDKAKDDACAETGLEPKTDPAKPAADAAPEGGDKTGDKAAEGGPKPE